MFGYPFIVKCTGHLFPMDVIFCYDIATILLF